MYQQVDRFKTIQPSNSNDVATSDFLISLQSTDPLQLTFTKSSIKIIKDLAEVFNYN